jgi:hypothetical protein
MGVVIKWFGSKFYFSTSWDASPRKYQTAELQKQWILIWIPWSSNLSFVTACYLRRHRSYVSCHKTFEIFVSAARQRCAPSLDFPKYSPRPWWLGAKKLSSSDPHPDTLLCIIYIYTHIYIYITHTCTHTYIYLYRCIYSDILSGILFGIVLWHSILSGICMRHIFWQSFWHSIWYIFGNSVIEVRQGTLWSGARDWGPARNTLIRSSRLRSGRDHFDILWSPITRSLQLRSGGDRFEPEISRGCCAGPADTAI